MFIQEEKPLPGQVVVPFEKPLVDAVEALIRYHRQKGGGTRIETNSQWDVVTKVFEVWATLYPDDYKTFAKAQHDFKSQQINKNASSREGEAMLQHQLNIPSVCHSLLRVLYPDQNYDKKFVSKFANKMPFLKMPDSKI